MAGFFIYYLFNPMSDPYYDEITAHHYAAYRPPLHELILSRCLKDEFGAGLDIGCGVGHSSIALSKYCDRVVGLEPSLDMLEKALQHPKVNYQSFDGKHIDLPDNSFNLVTFAGSLFYAKSQDLLDEVVRLSIEGSKVITYDFEVLLEPILHRLEAKPELSLEPYDHKIDFSGLKNEKVRLVEKFEELVDVILDSQQLTHLLLSTKEHYTALSNVFESEGLFQSVSAVLSKISGGGSRNIQAWIYYTIYEHKVD